MPENKTKSAIKNLEILQTVNPKSSEYLEMREQLLDINRELYKHIKNKVLNEEVSTNDLVKASGALTKTLEFEKADKFAIVKMIDEMEPAKVNLLTDMLSTEGALDDVDNQKLDRKVWS